MPPYLRLTSTASIRENQEGGKKKLYKIKVSRKVYIKKPAAERWTSEASWALAQTPLLQSVFLRRLSGGKSVVWLVALSATTPQRHTLFWESLDQKPVALGATRIKLPRWPVSKFLKAFKVPFAFLAFWEAGGMYVDWDHRFTHSSKTFLRYFLQC